jgi:hypothetical protein
MRWWSRGPQIRVLRPQHRVLLPQTGILTLKITDPGFHPVKPLQQLHDGRHVWHPDILSNNPTKIKSARNGRPDQLPLDLPKTGL